MIAYYAGAVFGGVFIIAAVSWVVQKLLGRFFEDTTVAIIASTTVAYVLTIGISALGHADGGPIRIGNVPILSYAIGAAIAAALRIKHEDKRQEKESESAPRTFE